MDQKLKLELREIHDFGINHNREVREKINDIESSKQAKKILKELKIENLL